MELSLLGLFDHPTLEEMSVEVENLILVKMGATNGDGNGAGLDWRAVQEIQWCASGAQPQSSAH